MINKPSDMRASSRASLLRRIFSRENLLALALCLIVILLLIVSASTAPAFIYQQF